MMTVPLLHGPAPIVAGALGLLALAWLLAGRTSRWWLRRLPLALTVAAALTAGLVFYVERVWQPFPDTLPPEVVLCVGGTLLAVVLAVLRWRPERGWPRRSVLPLCCLLAAVAAASTVNVYYGEFPTVGAMLPGPLENEVRLDQVAKAAPVATVPSGKPVAAAWHRPPRLPARGKIAEAAIPGRKSGFAARRALVYLPPAYLTSPRAQLPVLVLLSGSPGAPRDWFRGGRLAQRMDRFAAAHDGLAPVVVVPDILGRTFANPLCLDSRLGKVATYVDTDVPAWIRQNLQVDQDPRRWAIGGLSSGGTCALQAGIRSPRTYPTMLDFSGQTEPTLGDRHRTIQATYGGDSARFAAADPLRQLAGRTLTGSAAMLTVGDQDNVYGPQQHAVQKALERAGVPVEFATVPGGHTWTVFGAALERSLPWLGARLGLS